MQSERSMLLKLQKFPVLGRWSLAAGVPLNSLFPLFFNFDFPFPLTPPIHFPFSIHSVIFPAPYRMSCIRSHLSTSSKTPHESLLNSHPPLIPNTPSPHHSLYL